MALDSSIIGLIGIVAATVSYFLTRQRLSLAYSSYGQRLLGQVGDELPSDITVQFRGRNIPKLTRSIIILWNYGEKTIRGSEIVASDPLRFDTGEGAEILSTSVIKASRSVNGVQCTVDANFREKAGITFDFLDSRDGAVIEVLHTGERRHLPLVGTVRGLPDGAKNLGNVIRRRFIARALPFRVSPRKLGWFAVVTGFVAIICGIFIPFSQLSSPPPKEVPMNLMLPIAGVFYCGTGGLLLWMLRRRYPKGLHIDEFD